MNISGQHFLWISIFLHIFLVHNFLQGYIVLSVNFLNGSCMFNTDTFPPRSTLPPKHEHSLALLSVCCLCCLQNAATFCLFFFSFFVIFVPNMSIALPSLKSLCCLCCLRKTALLSFGFVSFCKICLFFVFFFVFFLPLFVIFVPNMSTALPFNLFAAFATDATVSFLSAQSQSDSQIHVALSERLMLWIYFHFSWHYPQCTSVDSTHHQKLYLGVVEGAVVTEVTSVRYVSCNILSLEEACYSWYAIGHQLAIADMQLVISLL